MLLGLINAGSAHACSCAVTAPGELLARADAAISGRLLSVEAHGATRAVYRYEVLHVYRGRGAIKPGSTLAVFSPRGSAACGLPEQVGRSYGLFLLGRPGRWLGGLCAVVSPRRLGAVARRSHAGQDAGSLASCAS